MAGTGGSTAGTRRAPARSAAASRTSTDDASGLAASESSRIVGFLQHNLSGDESPLSETARSYALVESLARIAVGAVG